MTLNMEAIRLKFRNDIYLPLTRRIRRKKLNTTDFTIISNNCWGGTVYESYGLRKNTPTAGMFIMPSDYVKFVKNLEYYIGLELIFINPNESKWKEVLEKKDNWGTYLIAKLDDIELHMLHYHDTRVAKEKWQKRKERIVWDKILYKFNDQNGATQKDIQEFVNLKLKNKVCFVAREDLKNEDGVIFISQPENTENGIKASREPFGSSRYVNINNLINNL